jgi:acid phosphatase (class A)
MIDRKLSAILAVVLAASAGVGAAGENAAPATGTSVLGQGYLDMQDLPDASLFIGPPPAAGSSAEARDVDLSNAARRLKDAPRWKQAAIDADLMAANVTSVMSCAAGREIGLEATPKAYKLLRTSAANLGFSTYTVKKKYQRPRPFMVNGDAQCTPDWDAILRKDGSYPSGHSAIGYGWGLILAELVPGRAAQIVARGMAFGDSRRFCNVHWASDVEAGRLAAAAVVAKLHSNAKFLKDMKAAKAEMMKAKVVAPQGDCAAETTALASGQ